MDNYSLLRKCLSGEPNILTKGAIAMHTRQYSRQQEKRNRIGNGTLVIGVDIGSDFNAACFAYSAL